MAGIKERKFTYPAHFAEARDGVTVTFRDLPEAITGGASLREAYDLAADCLEEAIAGRIADGEEIPVPSKKRPDEHLIVCPSHTAGKAALYTAMAESGKSKSGLARDLEIDEKEVRRMLDPRHATKQEKMDAAIRACGFVIESRVTAATPQRQIARGSVKVQPTARSTKQAATKRRRSAS